MVDDFSAVNLLRLSSKFGSHSSALSTIYCRTFVFRLCADHKSETVAQVQQAAFESQQWVRLVFYLILGGNKHE